MVAPPIIGPLATPLIMGILIQKCYHRLHQSNKVTYAVYYCVSVDSNCIAHIFSVFV